MKQDDVMTLTVLDDGTAKLEVDGISGANHVAADAIVNEFSKFLGGPLTVEKRPEGATRARHTQTRKHGR